MSATAEQRERAAVLLDRYTQLKSTHVGDIANVMTSGGLLKETLRMICELADLPVLPTYAPKACGPKPQKKPIIRDIVPIIDGQPLR